ncbi:hypothetical protein NL676_014265 [Syzygium grande]|nr:hypothetical protein NL676_014265 [Syzygium grande]
MRYDLSFESPFTQLLAKFCVLELHEAIKVEIKARRLQVQRAGVTNNNDAIVNEFGDDQTRTSLVLNKRKGTFVTAMTIKQRQL